MHKFLLILVLKQKNYSCLSKVKKIGAVFLRFMMMHEQIEVLEKSYVLRGSLREIHSWIGDSFFLTNESKISLPAWWCTSPHLQTGPWLVENTLQQQSHQSKDRLRMGPTQSWSQPPPPSPDFFLWGCLKDRVYKTNPQTIGELKRNIQTEMEAIDEATCRAVMSNFIRRIEMCQHQEGGHLEQLL